MTNMSHEQNEWTANENQTSRHSLWWWLMKKSKIVHNHKSQQSQHNIHAILTLRDLIIIATISSMSTCQSCRSNSCSMHKRDKAVSFCWLKLIGGNSWLVLAPKTNVHLHSLCPGYSNRYKWRHWHLESCSPTFAQSTVGASGWLKFLPWAVGKTAQSHQWKPL